MAYENGELLRTEQWLLRQGSITRLMQRDTSKQQIEVSTNDETSVSLRPQDEEQLSRKGTSVSALGSGFLSFRQRDMTKKR
jgi:chorismate-pyruvate lyase